MLEANKNRVFEKVFAVYNQNLLKRRFDSLSVSGLDFLLNKNSNIPLIIYCNHSSWWDGLVAYQISRKANLNSFLMMEEKQLKKLFLFRKLGAFSIVREKPRQAIESINYSANLLLENYNRTLWIFPQGEILPSDTRPIFFYSGLSKIIEKVKNCAVASLSMRYEFLGKFKPEIFVKINQPKIISVNQDFNLKKMTKIFSAEITDSLDELKSDIMKANLSNYQSII
jgi:1-acyl-sn-glycerol-3-phosphate acyltransferase